MATTEFTAYLKGPNYWDVWNKQFIAAAVSGHIWDKVNPETAEQHPFLAEPEEPDLHHFSVRGPAINANSPRRRREGSARDGLAPQDMPITLNDLTAEGHARFSTALSMYTRLVKKYEKEQDSIKNLKQFVIKTVAPHIFAVCCQPTESIRDWYSKLKQYTSLGQDELEIKARDNYRTATRTITQMPQDIEAWLLEWEKAMSNGEARQLYETQSANIWARDFFKAVNRVFPEWSRTAARIYRTKILDGTLTYRELARDFRLEIETLPPKPSTSKVSKGSFGPTFAEGKGKKRKRDAQKCQACGRPHATSTCFYLFPDEAPDWFTPSRDIQKKIDKWAKENPTEYEEAKQAHQTPSKRSKTDSSHTD